MRPDPARNAPVSAAKLLTAALLTMIACLTPSPSKADSTARVGDEPGGNWRPMSGVGAPSDREHPVSVWTGARAIFWSGFVGEPHTARRLYDGALYDPATDAWTPMASGPDTSFAPTATAWDGTELLAWDLAARSGSQREPAGWAYNPSFDIWRPLSTTGMPSPRFDAAVAWDGTALLVWGGFATGATDPLTFELADGARYDPVTDAWLPIASLSAPSPRGGVLSTWTGAELLVWRRAGHGEDHAGARYDPVADAWTSMAAGGPPTVLCYGGSAIWTGTDLLIWCPFDGAAVYNLASDAWRPASSQGVSYSWGNNQPPVWTGREMIVLDQWFGHTQSRRYDPTTDQWSPVEANPFINSFIQPGIVWAGAELLVLGSIWDGEKRTQTGFRYTPPR